MARALQELESVHFQYIFLRKLLISDPEIKKSEFAKMARALLELESVHFQYIFLRKSVISNPDLVDVN